MALIARVTGHAHFGGFISYHTVYKIDVSFGGSSWCVYRRYTAFSKLLEALTASRGEECMVTLGAVLPEKQLGQRIFSEIIEQRMQAS